MMCHTRAVSAAFCGAIAIVAQGANALTFHSSPDGRLNQCLTRAEFPGALAEMDEVPIVSWNAHKGQNSTYFVRGMVTADIAGSPDKKNWVRWTGWDHNEQDNGKSPEMFCVHSTGIGVLLLNNRIHEEMPDRPFGVRYSAPEDPNMGNGEFFIDADARGYITNGLYPSVVLNRGNNAIEIIYSRPNGKTMRVSKVSSNGAAHMIIEASDFLYTEAANQFFGLR